MHGGLHYLACHFCLVRPDATIVIIATATTMSGATYVANDKKDATSAIQYGGLCCSGASVGLGLRNELAKMLTTA